jgi:hypothetical protein
VGNEAKPGIIVAAVVVMLALVVFLGWRSFGPKGDTLPQATVDAHWKAKQSGANR